MKTKDINENKINKTILSVAPIATVVLIVIIWYIMAAVVDAEIIFPSPTSVVVGVIELFGKGSFYLKLLLSLARVAISFACAFTLSSFLAVIAYKSAFFERLLYPIILFVRATPTMSIIFLFLIWFSSDISPILVAFSVTFPLLYSSTLTSIKSCDEGLIEMSRVYKVPKRVQFTKLYLPHIATRVFSDSAVTLSLSVKLIIAAEALAQTSTSLGSAMQIAKSNLETAELFAYTIAAVIISAVLEISVNKIRKTVERKYA